MDLVSIDVVETSLAKFREESVVDFELKGMKAVVTGGSRGIGRAIVEELATQGCDVALCARNADEVRGTVDALGAHGVRATGASVDVSDGPALKAWIEDAAGELGGVDVLIANVSALAMGADEAGWRKGLEVDILGTVHAVEAALPFLEQSKAPSIVAIASTAALEIYTGLRAYTPVKAAVIAYVSNLSQYLAPKGIRANTVSPGAVYFKGGVWNQVEQADPERYRDMLERNPMGRMAKPEEVANAVTFLASPAASFVTGTNLVVDGGLTRRIQY